MNAISHRLGGTLKNTVSFSKSIPTRNMAFTLLIHHLSPMMEKVGFSLTFNEELPRQSICMWTMHVQRSGNGNRGRGALTLWPSNNSIHTYSMTEQEKEL
jgi:hypothetical protein